MTTLSLCVREGRYCEGGGGEVAGMGGVGRTSLACAC